MDVLQLQALAFNYEKEGNLEEAIKIYWQLINSGFDGSNPYERLRIIYAKQKNWVGAIKACQAYIDLEKKYSGYLIKEKRMKEWIRKYNQRIEKDYIYSSLEEIVKNIIKEASLNSIRKYHSPIPEYIPIGVFPDWSQNDLLKIKVPHFEQYYPTRNSMNKSQLAFFNKWLSQWKIGKPVYVDSNISYLFTYTYEVLNKIRDDPEYVLKELRLLQYVYRHEEKYRDYIDHWIFDVLLFKSDYLNALSFITSKKDTVTSRINIILSLKKELGIPISGLELLTLSQRLFNKIIKENIEIASDILEEKVRSFEEEHKIDLLTIISEKYALKNQHPYYLFAGVPSIEHHNLEIDHYNYSELGEFSNVLDDWSKEAENSIRELLDLPRIGEGWLNETILYNIIKNYFEKSGYEVIHHAYPPFLKRQELDIFIPALKIGVEYQGLQHYKPIVFFGGENAFKKRVKLDQQKKKLCQEFGVKLVEFRYDEPIEEKLVINRILELLAS